MMDSKSLPWSPRVDFAMHAPPVPNGFKQKTVPVVRTVGGQSYVAQTDEPALDRMVRWRLTYADAMVKALRESTPLVE